MFSPCKQIVLGIFLIVFTMFVTPVVGQDATPEATDVVPTMTCLQDDWCYTKVVDQPKNGEYQIALLADPRDIANREPWYYVILLKDNQYQRVLMAVPISSDTDFALQQVDVNDWRQLWPPDQVGWAGDTIVWARWKRFYVSPNADYTGTNTDDFGKALVVCVDLELPDKKPYDCSGK